MPSDALTIPELLDGYRTRRLEVRAYMEGVLARIDAAPERKVWITRLTRAQVMAHVEALVAADPHDLPLYGVPFAIKDNIDLAGVPTSAGCPAFAYTPDQSAFVVQRLIEAGAVPIGKTNLDQFATGLVGVRSPYGACQNSFDPAYISGGSSSGSAVATAMGLVSFALGTDTAGSGRIPAAFNNIVGLKPSCGLLSTRGVVPACRSLDAVSVFALTASDAAQVLAVAQGFDAADPYARRATLPRGVARTPRIGAPAREQLEFFGDTGYARCWREALGRAQALGWSVREVDIEPFLSAARLLYEGPWIAERYAAVGAFIDASPEAVWPTTRTVIGAGRAPRAVDLFEAQHRLQALRRAAERIWDEIDALLTPTAGALYTIAMVQAEPIVLNNRLGRYTNFVNLMDLCAVAAPAGFRGDGMPFGVTFSAPRGGDSLLLTLADLMQRGSCDRLGALQRPLPPYSASPATIAPGYLGLVVCGAHMSGLPLNGQLLERGGSFIRAARTASCYRLYALPGGPPERPGLVRSGQAGAAIEVELWALPEDQFGSLLRSIPAPLGLGAVELQGGEVHTGFLCEASAAAGARDITSFGGWRAYRKPAGNP